MSTRSSPRHTAHKEPKPDPDEAGGSPRPRPSSGPPPSVMPVKREAADARPAQAEAPTPPPPSPPTRWPSDRAGRGGPDPYDAEADAAAAAHELHAASRAWQGYMVVKGAIDEAAADAGPASSFDFQAYLDDEARCTAAAAAALATLGVPYTVAGLVALAVPGSVRAGTDYFMLAEVALDAALWRSYEDGERVFYPWHDGLWALHEWVRHGRVCAPKADLLRAACARAIEMVVAKRAREAEQAGRGSGTGTRKRQREGAGGGGGDGDVHGRGITPPLDEDEDAWGHIMAHEGAQVE